MRDVGGWIEPEDEAQRQTFINGCWRFAQRERDEAALLRIKARQAEGRAQEFEKRAADLERKAHV